MSPARSIIGLAALILVSGLPVLGVGADLGQTEALQAAATSEVGAGSQVGQSSQVRLAQWTASDRQRERRRARRDRASRRLARGGPQLLPHFADYAVHETGFATTRFKSAHGTLSVDLVDDCGDWTLQEKWDLDLRDQDDRSSPSSLIYRASEVRSADKFVFAYSRDHLGEQTDFIGDVIEVDGGYMARFQAPEIADQFMTADMTFPISHLRQVLAEARRDRTGFEMMVFDGGNAFPYRAVTTISQPLLGGERNPRIAEARTELDRQTSDRLPDGRYWPVRVDYFPPEDAYAPPVFVREFLLHESGVVLSFHFDYGDVQMDARLKTLDIRETRECPN